MFLTLLLVILGAQTSVTQNPASESADVVLLIDSSDVIGEKAFSAMKNFVQKMINRLPIGPDRYHVALVQYSDDVHVEFQLHKFRGKNPMLTHLRKQFLFRGGSLNTGNAIQKVHETFFKTPRRDRNKILVVVTSGASEDDVEGPARRLKDDGIKIIALGTQTASPQELQSVATGPFYYNFNTTKDLVAFSQRMPQVIDDAIQRDDSIITLTPIPLSPTLSPTRSPTVSQRNESIKECFNDSIADVAFVVDEGISLENSKNIAEFLKNTVNALDVHEDCIRIALVKYSTEPQEISLLKNETDRYALLQKIKSFPPREGKANLGAAINFTRTRVFGKSAGSRRTQGVEQVATIITHRQADDSLHEAAAALSRAGVTVFAIGIEGANYTQLSQIASYPPEGNVLKLKTFSELPRQEKIFQKKLFNQIQHTLYVESERKKKLKTGCEETEEADVYFLIDGSSSIHPDDFRDMKTFLMGVIELFTVGPDAVRFGVVQYSTGRKTEFELDENPNKNDLEKAINNIKQSTGDTYTGGALNAMQPLFEKARKQRGKKVPCYLIVMTDGEAHDNVAIPAKKLRNAEVDIYAIGVGKAVQAQLLEMTDSPSRVYFVHQFDSLKVIKNNVVRDICSEACKVMKADIMFLVDSSGSIGSENFGKMKTFMSGLVNKSNIGLDQVRIGVVQFSGTNKEEFPLDRYSAKMDIIEAIGRMSLIGDYTLTGGALQFVSAYFKTDKGARPSVHKILILITDGEAQDEVKGPAENLRNSGIIIYSVGVFNANKQQLEEISGKPERVFYVENFDILKQLESNIIFGTCNPDEDCKRIGHLDVVFIIDSSGSIFDRDYSLMKDFMIGLVNKSTIGKDQVQFGAVKYSDDPQTIFHLNTYTTKSSIVEAIQRDTQLGGNTYTAKALRHTEALFTAQHGSRIHSNVPQILIVLTDGDSHDAPELEEVSKRLRARGIVIYAVGIKGAKTEELQTMAGPNKAYYFVDTFEELKNLSTIISDDACNKSNPECKIRGQLVVLLDSSPSVPEEDFKKIQVFLEEFLNAVVYNGNIQVGMAQFSDHYQEKLQLGDYQSKSELIGKIANFSRMQSKETNIGAALKEVTFLFKSPKRRVARNVPQRLLIITDGRSRDKISQPAEKLRIEGVDIYAVGVGKIDQAKLQQITDSPDRKFTAGDFSELPDIKKQLITHMCDEKVKAECFVDVVMGFDISSQKSGELLLQGQLEKYLPGIIKKLTSVHPVSCSKGTQTQFNVAMPPFLSDFQANYDNILEKLSKAVIDSPFRLNTNFLDILWKEFQKQAGNQKRSKVILLFSDGLDEDAEALEQKSDELRKNGLDGLITVALRGATNVKDLLNIEFGKGFKYATQLTIDMHNIANRLFEYADDIAERTCCCIFCKCVGEEGYIGLRGAVGPKGTNGTYGLRGPSGEDGLPGPDGGRGERGKQGYIGCHGSQGMKGIRGEAGEKGENGIDGVSGINGEEGSHGLPGLKGEKGDPGQQGSTGTRGLPGDPGQKGLQGNPGSPGEDNQIRGEPGPNGAKGFKGEPGLKGSTGLASSQGNKGSEGRRGRPGASGVMGIPGPEGLQGKEGFRGPQGTLGIAGVKGQKGNSGNKGPQGNLGVRGPKGNIGKPGTSRNKGESGDPGQKGERGSRGPRGRMGEDGLPGPAIPGPKGSKGQDGFLGDFGIQGIPGNPGIPGEPGPKGNRGITGGAGPIGSTGTPGDRGRPGRPGAKGPRGPGPFSSCQLLEYVREHSPCWKGTRECPLYPTELVFALDVSEDVTLQIFERMRQFVIEIVNNTKIRESNCPVGARVAIVFYNSSTYYLIRFSDFQSKKRLLQELNALAYQRSSGRRDIGESMRFVARNIFKRIPQGPNVRKIAVFFSNGQSSNPVSINTAVLEFSALDILPAVITFKNIPEINRAFAIDESELFQVINIHEERDYIPALQRFRECVLCYDKCDPSESCLRSGSPQTLAYMDAAFILESSRKISPVEFEKLKDFLSTAVDNFDISANPRSSLTGDRVALVSHAPLEFRPQTQQSPGRTEFDLLTYSNSRRMKRHIQESVRQLNGSTAVGHAIQWTIKNIFSDVPNQRKYKLIFVISVGETSWWDKEVLRDAALRAQCQGYTVFVLSLGHGYAHVELEELASTPLEHHLVQLGRIHKPELEYAVNFLKPFLYLLRNEINKYPPAQLRRTCANISTQRPLYTPQSQRAIAAVDESVSTGINPMDTESAFLVRNAQQTIVLGN